MTIASDGRGWTVVGYDIAARGPPGKARSKASDLDGVKGIGKRRLEEIRPRVTAE